MLVSLAISIILLGMSGNTYFCVSSIIIIVTWLQVAAVERVIVVDVHVYIGWFIEIFLALMLWTAWILGHAGLQKNLRYWYWCLMLTNSISGSVIKVWIHKLLRFFLCFAPLGFCSLKELLDMPIASFAKSTMSQPIQPQALPHRFPFLSILLRNLGIWNWLNFYIWGLGACDASRLD